MYYFSNFVNCPSRCIISMILPFPMHNFFDFAYASGRAKMEKYKYQFSLK
jgi:hypothetical protein